MCGDRSAWKGAEGLEVESGCCGLILKADGGGPAGGFGVSSPWFPTLLFSHGLKNFAPSCGLDGCLGLETGSCGVDLKLDGGGPAGAFSVSLRCFPRLSFSCGLVALAPGFGLDGCLGLEIGSCGVDIKVDGGGPAGAFSVSLGRFPTLSSLDAGKMCFKGCCVALLVVVDFNQARVLLCPLAPNEIFKPAKGVLVALLEVTWEGPRG